MVTNGPKRSKSGHQKIGVKPFGHELRAERDISWQDIRLNLML
jgi:hypothetical protein